MVVHLRQLKPIADILVAVTNRLLNPLAWSRRAGARTYEGIPCDVCSPAAVSWCITAALECELGKIADVATRIILTEAIELHLLATARYQLGMPELDSLAQFNDDRSTTHGDVLDLLDVATLALYPSATRVRRSLNA
ncbi:MAG: hypothetical protein PGN33_20015 [Methylobacterium radiotolerans]